MNSFPQLEARFLDRYGCGDELYLDSQSKVAAWLTGSLRGSVIESLASLDSDFEDFDFPIDAMGEDDDVAADD